MSSILDIDDYKEDKWEMGIVICKKCRESYISKKHTSANKNKLQCPFCGQYDNYFISAKLFRNLFERIKI
jgi:rubrerythrin